jgi:hypothetical protein
MYRWRFGDSGILVDKDLFYELGGFNTALLLEEDHEFIKLLYATKNFTVFPVQLSVSDRLFRANGFLKTFCLYTMIHLLYLMKAPLSLLFYLVRKLK